MSEPHSNWRAMFDTKRQERGPGRGAETHPSAPPSLGGYDDGHIATPHDPVPPSPPDITDAAALALAADPKEYRPWVLQRGRARPALMLHLRRYDPRTQQWTGWAIAYPHLVAVEYVGASLISLDFSTRHFVIEGQHLGELVDHLQNGTVLCIQEFASQLWSIHPDGSLITAIRIVRITAG